MLGNTKGRLINKYVPDYVLFDLETTGTSSNYDKVIEISAVKVQSGVIVDEFSRLVNPGRSIPYAASMVNHITDDMVAEAPEFEEILQAFMDFVGDSILVGHNINSFDMKFLYRDSERYFGQTVTNDYIDSASEKAKVNLCPICGQPMRKRNGRFGEFWGCSGFPGCRYTENI